MLTEEQKLEIIRSRRRKRWAVARLLILLVAVLFIIRALIGKDQWDSILAALLTVAVWAALHGAQIAAGARSGMKDKRKP